ncbi:MAG: RimK family alpha-L-glutamate ligase [Candidatus Nanopelagicales bacterium]
MTDVVYVTHEPDPSAEAPDIDTDIDVALAAFAWEGITFEVAAWDDHGFDWSAAGLVLVRSPWDYVPRRREFLEWTRDVSALTRLENPAEVIEANTDKTYLRELADRGVHVVPTGWVARPDDADAVVAQVRATYGPRVVVKPTISAGARDTILTDDPVEAAAHARNVLVGGRGAMVQPYLESVAEEGETSVLVIDGDITHAVRRRPALTEGGNGGDGTLTELTDELRAMAEQVISASGSEKLLYARVDVVRDPDGSLALLELELTEPTLFLTLNPDAARVLAAGVAARLP